MGCCSKSGKITIKSIFILFNALVILFSILLVIYQLVVTIGDFADAWQTDIANLLNISTAAVSTFMIISTLLASFFSAIAAYGMEAANFRQYWDDEIFQLCCCNLLKIKMIVYVFVTGVGGIGLIVATALFHTDILFDTTDILSSLDNYILGSCNDLVADLVTPLQENNKCCGLSFTFANDTSTTNTNPCGRWEDNEPIGCGCNNVNDQADRSICISAADATNLYNCQMQSVSDDFIYFNGCQDAIIETYFTGFTVIYAVGYIIGAVLIFACSLGCIIYVNGKY